MEGINTAHAGSILLKVKHSTVFRIYIIMYKNSEAKSIINDIIKI